MKKISLLLILTLILGVTGCQKSDTKVEKKEEVVNAEGDVDGEGLPESDSIKIQLSNDKILVNGENIGGSDEAVSEEADVIDHGVYKANDIIYYMQDQGIAYGEGTEEDAHSQIEADAHTVVHITKPGTYEVSGTMDAGQIFVDLGDDAKKDPQAVVNLILNNVDITCTVAPAILFYNVYECAQVPEDIDDAVMDVDISSAGANLILADESVNKVYGSYVAKIYESCELNEEGTEVVDSKKLHKFDGAVYSKKSMNIFGDTGTLNIVAENEGLCSDMHMTIHGGNIFIKAGNDGINTSEDNVSVFVMNNGVLDIQVSGETGEGDGIDSNGWLIINGGTVSAYACETSADAGLDADNGVYINGGTVAAAGNMMSEITGTDQTAVTFMVREAIEAGKTYEVKDGEGNVILEVIPTNTFSILIISSEALTADGTYTLWNGRDQIAEGMQGAMGMGGFGMGGARGEMPEGMQPSEGMQPPEGMEPPKGPNGERPEPPEGMNFPEGMEPPEKPKNNKK